MRHQRLLYAFLAASLCATASPVLAQESPPADDPAAKKSLDHYQKGRTAYDLGRFEEAIKEFEAAYETKPHPAYIYNLAQTYKQKGDHQKAVFYYRRYLKLEPTAKNREVIETRITELEDLIKKQADQREKPPDGLDTPDGQRTSPDATRPGTDPDVRTVAPMKPSVARLAVSAGPAFVSLGDGPPVPTQFSVFAQGAYTLHFGKLDLELGAGLGLTPMPFNTVDQTDTGTSLLLSAVGLIGVRYAVHPRVGLRLEAGAGYQSMGGLKAGNPFTVDNEESSAVGMFAARGAVGVDFRVAGGLLISVMPAFVFSPAPEKLDESISRVTRFEILVGIGYAL
jgi:Tetratricopeptide repeat